MCRHTWSSLLGGEAGLRCGEIMALEWTDVDLTNGNSVSRDPTGRATSRCRKVGGSGMCR